MKYSDALKIYCDYILAWEKELSSEIMKDFKQEILFVNNQEVYFRFKRIGQEALKILSDIESDGYKLFVCYLEEDQKGYHFAGMYLGIIDAELEISDVLKKEEDYLENLEDKVESIKDEVEIPREFGKL